MPKEIYGDYAEVDDVISIKKTAKHRIKLVNLSCKGVMKTRFVREYTSIVRQIYSNKHPWNNYLYNKNQY
jgi:hypothetical protein